MSKPGGMKNIGPVSGQWLAAAGIMTLDDLRKIGAVEAYGRVCDLGIKPSLNLLWALEGAVRGIPFHALTGDERKSLRERVAERRPQGPCAGHE
ncbi:MAG: TfoX/Sxy family protein [Candidatus Omnitrophica bacterium]|nr:TfoX/Sxy family protein [Candidatus Omnitrophota bacterium]MCB9720343.1 TfoX/Sxy family protein [Candidatus Omnitrophota bacterium]